MNYYSNLEYANERLRGTIVNTKRGPSYINFINLNGIADITLLKNQEVVHIPYLDIDLTPVQLGYLNLDKTCVFVSRIPSRSWKQGLSQETINYESSKPRAWPPFELYNTIENIYPSFEEARLMVNTKEREKVAFSREFAVGKDQLFYCGRLVGNCSKIPYLDKQNIYLLERLREYVS